MGIMRFAFDPQLNANGLIKRLCQDAFLAGNDSKVLPGQQLVVQETQLAIRKADDRSAKLNFPWPLPERGEVLFTTGSLMDREEPYHLLVEMARGKISVVRNQSANWQQMGMAIPEEFYDRLDDAQDAFIKSTQSQDDVKESSRLGAAALENAQKAADILMASFVMQRVRLQRRRSPVSPVDYICGADFDLKREDNLEGLLTHFDEICLPLHWKMAEEETATGDVQQIDAAIDFLFSQKKTISAGPLLDFADEGLPHWLMQWQGDVISMQSLMCDFVETVVSRYAGRIRKWDLAANSERGPRDESWKFLTEEVRLRLLSRALDIIQQIDNKLEVSIRITDPWGIYHGEGNHILTPVNFIDMLTRARGRVSSLKLVLTDSYEHVTTPPFDWLELSRLIDYWSALGIPLQVLLAAPSTGTRMPNARYQVDPQEAHLLSPESQSDWYANVIPLLVAKESISGIQFDHFHDGASHRYAAAGFVDAAGKTKSSFQQLTRFQSSEWTL